MSQHPHEHKAQNDNQTISEMMPFLFYAAIPIILTICLAYFAGTTVQ